MTEPQHSLDFEKMTPSEQILHVQDLWERISSSPDRVPVGAAVLDELDRRLAAHAEDPGAASPWDEVRERIRTKG
jgi:putative addiction module component (TIGR02574 family)